MKLIRKIILCAVICLMLATSAVAVNSDNLDIADVTAEYSDVARTEQVQWVYMEINGVEHMRLWSITRGIWLTDWIPCE